MPIVGEMTGWMSQSPGDFGLTITWDIELPPSSALAKMSLGGYDEGDDVSHVLVSIVGARRRKPDNTDEFLHFGSKLAFGDPNLTGVSFWMEVVSATGTACWTIEFWE
ncbi:MAG TPA: hypothetical protein VEN81_17700 [Planctomycetota bacterium]|nr:hypothetical protein [Planctomycetota bacterium]